MTSSEIQYLRCHSCGKTVSTGFIPVPVDGFKGLVVRAYIECPECIESQMISARIKESITFKGPVP